MTISRILNSLNFYTPQIQAEPPVQTETVIHAWHLVNGDKAYLIRNNDKLECHFLNGNDKIISEIDPPSFFTLEEAIDFLVELHPVLLESDSVKFIENGEEIHTWHLAMGKKAYLIRNNDKLECHFVNGNDRTISEINPPSSFSLEEAINFLVELYPILLESGSVKFIENQEELHTWNVKYGNPVNLVRIGEEIGYRTIYDGKTLLKKISIPNDLSLSEQIAWVLDRHPHVYPVKERFSGQSPKSTCIIEFEEKVTEEKSAIDAKILLDINNWCVTLLNTENSGSCPCTWMGHASLIIETIEEGGYFARSAHLTKENGAADIRFLEVHRENLIKWTKKVSKTETWSRPRQDIQRIINQVFLEFTSQKNGNPLIFFKMDSGKMQNLAKMINLRHIINQPANSDDLLLENINKILSKDTIFLEEQKKKIYSCINYSLRNLSLANIHPPLQTGGVLSKTFFPTPVLYTGSKIKAITQEAALIASYVTLYSLPYIPSILFALARANQRGVSQGIAMASGWGLADVVSAYSTYYFHGKQFGGWLDFMNVNSSRKKSTHDYRRQADKEDHALLNLVGNVLGENHKKFLKRIGCTPEHLYKILKIVSLQNALRN